MGGVVITIRASSRARRSTSSFGILSIMSDTPHSKLAKALLGRRARLNRPDVFPLVSESHAAAIGYVAINWSGVEAASGYLIAKLLGLERIAAAAITENLNAPATVNLITVLVRLSGDKAVISRWKQLCVEHDELRPQRNDAVHAEWCVVGIHHMAARTKARDKLTISFSPVKTENLDLLADRILILSEDILAFSGMVTALRTSELIMRQVPPGLENPSPIVSVPSQAQTRHPPKLSSAQKRALKTEPLSS